MTLLEHIDTLESEIQRMTKDGHHVHPLVMKAMLNIDDAIKLLHTANRTNNNNERGHDYD